MAISIFGRPRIKDISDLSGFWGGFSQDFDLDGTERVDSWNENFGSTSLDLTPPLTSPSTEKYLFGGHRGILLSQTLTPASVKALVAPYEIWMVIRAGGLVLNQRILQSADLLSDILQIRSNGQVRLRINNTNRDISATGAIVTDTPYVVGIFCDSSGNLTCEINGTSHDESVVDAGSWDFASLGHASASQTIYIGALHIFDSTLSDSERAYIRQKLDDFRIGTTAVIGLSNTWDALQGYDTIGGVHMFHSASGYNNNALKDWYDNIGTTGSPPWLTFINELNAHPFCDKIWFYMGIAVADAETDLSTVQTWATDVLAEARSQMDTAGHDGTNAICYASHMAFYPDPAVSCAVQSSGARDLSVALQQWAIGGGLTNCQAGPELPDITFARADDGDPTSPCHVEESHKPDDGWALRNFEAFS